MNTIKIITKILMPILLWIVVFNTIITCEDEILLHIIDYKDKWVETYYIGIGHGNKVMLDSYPYKLDNGSIQVEILLTLDNVTKNSFEIRERFIDSEIHNRLYYWLSFKYKTFSTNCKEVRKDMVVFPVSISSPSWWPDDLKKSFFKKNRTKYMFYRCRAGYAGYDLSFFQYFAIDNTNRTGYYWNTMLVNTDNKSVRKYYYDWE
ncbi:hypothetical protein [Candidatus Magnetominusculus xianensis]|uniref:Secreted protein n=1 Tax=Candidatus Magnetominusculus xianensis TaxID=1748249 RepID=A0ABR5SFX2_9BACT|nr:hypothetical protein [Candidatus Magnetominusculus xianensis]KWT86919.1 hypothetical protein ASN18_1391 [Candidatus Magnetominusculus xianensis]MBF0403956.1 hypothetical protein [Nitrospirota bacterium]